VLERVLEGVTEAVRSMHVSEKSPDGACNQREGGYKTEGYGEAVIHAILLLKYPYKLTLAKQESSEPSPVRTWCRRQSLQ